MIIDIVCTFSATTIQAETKSVSLVLTFPATQLPSNICEEVQDCLGISESGEADYFLNEQGDWVQVQGGGGSQTLNEVLIEGNETDGEDIFVSDGDAIFFDNGSRVRKGLTDAGNGGAKGVALVCSLDYELKWEAGRLYTMQQDGFTIREVSHNFTATPTVNDDITKGFVIGSRWILDNGDVYVCSDETTGAAVWALIIEGTVTSVGLTMPSAFTVANSPITSSGDIAVTGAGLVSQYVRGDGSLANFPASTGGGASLSFYLNGSVSQGTFGGVAFKEMDRVPILGAGTDFTINTNGYIQSFITDANVPNLLEIPAGNWNFETYFSASSGGGSPSFYLELYKWDGATLSLIASSSANPEGITNGTVTDLYVSALAVPQTALLATDRLAVRIYVNNSGRTIKLHTENNHLSQVITTFSTGLTALNGLTDQVQNFAVGTSGTDFAISSATGTHTFNLPIASATNTGKLSSADWSTFDGKQNALGFTSENVANKQNSLATDGTGTKYPTVDAINAGLLRSQLIAKFNGSAQLTTTIINTNFFIVSVPIPPNTFIAGDMLLVHSRNYKSGATSTTSTFSLAIGTVDNDTSGVVIGINQSGANISRHLLPIDRRFSVTNSTTIYGYRPDIALSNDGINTLSGSNFPQSITGLDFTKTQYLKVLVQTTALSVLTENVSLEIWRLR
jgi:hypothetical protein